jgi:flagellar hook-basal body complex protein FliE
MANMTIENIGGVLQSGNVEKLIDRGQSIQAPQAPEVPNVGGAESGPGGKTFGEVLSQSLDKVNDLQVQADRGVNELVAGRNKNIHETMLLMEKADMSFRLAMQVRNKVIEAYREILRMQV